MHAQGFERKVLRPRKKKKKRNTDSGCRQGWKNGKQVLLKEVRESADVSGLQLFFRHNKRHKGLATRMHPPRCTIDPEGGENVVSSAIRYEWYLRYGVRGTPGVMEKVGDRIYVPPPYQLFHINLCVTEVLPTAMNLLHFSSFIFRRC